MSKEELELALLYESKRYANTLQLLHRYMTPEESRRELGKLNSISRDEVYGEVIHEPIEPDVRKGGCL